SRELARRDAEGPDQGAGRPAPGGGRRPRRGGVLPRLPRRRLHFRPDHQRRWRQAHALTPEVNMADFFKPETSALVLIDYQVGTHTGGRHPTMGGITTDICLVFPAISAAQEGFEVQAVIDASGSPFGISEDMARRRMERAGVGLTATNTIVAELVHDWATKA